MATSSDLIIGQWGARFAGRALPCAIGRGGIGTKIGEGDGITPRGRFRIMDIRVRADRHGFPGRAIGPFDVWSDDPQDRGYNHPAQRWDHRFGHELLRRGDRLYDIFAILDINYPVAAPGKGSAIFLHCWRRPRFPTAGCVAFARRDLIWILARWRSRSRVVIR